VTAPSILPVEKDVDHSQRKFVLSSAEVGTLSLHSTEHNSYKRNVWWWNKLSSVIQLQQ